MKTTKILAIAFVFFLIGCGSVKNNMEDYKLKNEVLYFKNEKIGHVREMLTKENEQEVEKNYTIVFDTDVKKNLISREDVIIFFKKKYNMDNYEVLVIKSLANKN